jgi:hypothetical protein
MGTLHEDQCTFFIITRSFSFLENRAVYGIMWKKCRTEQTTDDNMAHAHRMLDT